MLDGLTVLPLKLGSFLPVAGPEATYSLLLLLLEEELPGVEAALLTVGLVLPGVTLPVAVLVTEPGAELPEELLHKVAGIVDLVCL